MIVVAWALKFFATPLGRWVIIVALVLMALFAGGMYERNIGYQERADEDAKKDELVERAYLALVGTLHTAYGALTEKYNGLRDASERGLKAAEQKRLHDLAEQKRRLEHDLSPAAVAVCPYLPYGYLVHRYNAAQIARGADTRAAEPASDAQAAAPGISITAAAQLDDDQAGAYKQCREQLAAWGTYADQVKAWREEANQKLEQILKTQGE